MKRADRLFRLTQILKDGAWHAAHELAALCDVSERSIWRDMGLLSASGLAVEATRGLGYRLAETVPLPPLHLSELEFEALRLGLTAVSDEADPDLQAAARQLLAKLDGALPGHGIEARPRSGMGRATFAHAAAGFAHMPLLREAIRKRLMLRLRHEAPALETTGDETTSSFVRPLRMDYLGGFWSLTGWCETRAEFEVYQVHRILSLAATGETFAPEAGKRIEDYLARFAGGPHGN